MAVQSDDLDLNVEPFVKAISRAQNACADLADAWQKMIVRIGGSGLSEEVRKQTEESRKALSQAAATANLPLEEQPDYVSLTEKLVGSESDYNAGVARLKSLGDSLTDLEGKYNKIKDAGKLDSDFGKETALDLRAAIEEYEQTESEVEQLYQNQEQARESLRQYVAEFQNLKQAQEEAASEEDIPDQSVFSRAGEAARSFAESLGATKIDLDNIDDSAEGAEESIKGVGNAAAIAGVKVGSSDSFFKQLWRSIKNIAFYRAVRGVISGITKSVKEGSNALAIWSQQFDTGATGPLASFNDNISSVASNLLYIRNSIVAAAEPIIAVLTPAFNALAAAIANAFNFLNQFFSALTGKSFYSKAIKNNANYAGSLQKASSAQKNFLAGFDELERVESSSGGGGGGAGSSLGIDPSQMWQKSEISDAVKRLVDPIKGAFANLKSIWDAQSDDFMESLGHLGDALFNLFASVDREFFQDFFGEGRVGAVMFGDALWFLRNAMDALAIVINDILTPFLQGFIKGFTDGFGVIYEVVRTIFGPIIEAFFNFFDVLDEHKETVQAIAEKIGYLVGIIASILAAVTIAKGAITVFGLVISALTSPVGLVISVITGLILIFTALYDNVKPFRDFVDAVVAEAEKIVPGIIQGIQEKWGQFKQLWNEFCQDPITTIKKIFRIAGDGISGVLKDIGKGIVQGLANGIESAKDFVVDTVEGIGDAVKEGFKNIIDDAVDWGKDMVQGFADGISSAADFVKNAAKGVASKASSFLHFSHPDEGPLADYEKWAPDFMKGFAKGISDNSYLVTDSVKNLAGGIRSGLNVPSLGISGVSASTNMSAGFATQSQINANSALADVVWQGCMAVIQAIQENRTEIKIGDDVIGHANDRYTRKQAIINGGAY